MSGYTADAMKADSVSKSFIYFFIADSVERPNEWDSTMFKYKPDVISRGFVYMREAEGFMDEVREIAADSMSNYLAHHRGHIDRMQLKNRIKDDVAKFIYQKTKRKPMVLPVIMDL
jgi:mRNA degradation ribonuclease J1/J2